MITNLGKELRKLRLDLGITLFEMAQTIGVSSSYLSSVETGKKAANDQLLQQLTEKYPEVRNNRDAYQSLIEQTKREVRISLASNQAPRAQEFATAFARKFETLSEADFEDLIAVFNNKEGKL